MKMKVTMSRDSNNLMCIRILDETSRIEFVEVKMTMEALWYAITGVAYQEAEGKVHDLQWVGKTRVCEQRKVLCPLKTYDRKELSAWLNEHCQEDGWILQTYLGSQSSISYTDDGTILRYNVIKYVDDFAQEPA